MLIRLELATAVVVAVYLLVTLMRGEPETNTKDTNEYMPSSAQSSSMSDKMNDKMADKASLKNAKQLFLVSRLGGVNCNNKWKQSIFAPRSRTENQFHAKNKGED